MLILFLKLIYVCVFFGGGAGLGLLYSQYYIFRNYVSYHLKIALNVNSNDFIFTEFDQYPFVTSAVSLKCKKLCFTLKRDNNFNKSSKQLKMN